MTSERGYNLGHELFRICLAQCRCPLSKVELSAVPGQCQCQATPPVGSHSIPRRTSLAALHRYPATVSSRRRRKS
jgi:hypothetical protein